MPTPLENALKRRDVLRAELARIERFIEDYRAFSDEGTIVEPVAVATVGSGGNLKDNQGVDNYRGRRLGKTAPSEIARLMERIIREVGRPMTRGEIVEAVARRDVEIPAQDKKRYVGTIAWRHKGIFVNVEGRGYWLRAEFPVRQGPGMEMFAVGEQSDELPNI
jgi:hypothetical protein